MNDSGNLTPVQAFLLFAERLNRVFCKRRARIPQVSAVAPRYIEIACAVTLSEPNAVGDADAARESNAIALCDPRSKDAGASVVARGVSARGHIAASEVASL